MNSPQQPDLLSSLAGEYDRFSAAQRERTMAELRQVIEQVPEQSEFTNTTRYKLLGPLFTVIALGMLAMGIHQGKTGLMVCGGFLALLFVLVTWQHRHAGQHAFMRLTRSQLFVDTLSAPVALADVVDIFVKDEGLVTLQKLTLRPGSPLPTHRAVRQLFGNQAMALKSPQPHIRIHSAGLMSHGRKLDCDEIAALLNAYWQAAHAQQELDALQRNG
ncbi:hypothetical protein [Pseudomonas vanderleydeniana]|uniref:Uncharacterized protein n=1 Tax=Pseudomonas vanderleydeniana TaxID=2745495 RepID=A0A9E6PRH8_9PSED|nr:hypothetical protein [Pseudomonas vanderleydeniana]QXI31554.1 hypothetical protein HU752_019805 [Pseudomonas vanderleydeniana]